MLNSMLSLKIVFNRISQNIMLGNETVVLFAFKLNEGGSATPTELVP